MNHGKLVTIREASAQLGLAESTIRKWVLLRKLGACKMGRAVRIPANSIDRMIEEGYRPAEREA